MTAKNPTQPPVGIDLGTTYTVAAYIDGKGRPVTIPDECGDLLTPSAILFDDGELICGKEAVKSSTVLPDSYAECFKRDMGSAFARRTLCGQKIPPEVLSAFILQRVKRGVERRLGPIRQVVITVPAFFDEGRRRATQEGGRLAGLDVLDIINEPTAAALVYGYDSGTLETSRTDGNAGSKRLLIYDLGGGTFDVSILEVNGTRFRTLATDGDVQLGGKDFDQRLVDHIAAKFMAAQGVDPRSDPQDAAQLWLDAQEAKHALSECRKTTVVCFHAGVRMRIEITRTEFEEIIRDLVARSESTTALVVSQAKLDWEQIDHVLLVGGSSRIPMVRDMLRQLSGKEPGQYVSPDEAVAHGAALYAGSLMLDGQSLLGPKCELINVNSHSLGVVGVHRKTDQRTNVVLIPKNTALPARAVRVFKTAKYDQRTVQVPIIEGESHRPEDCILLGECVVRGLPPGLPEGTPIEVEYAYAANGRIAVSARVPLVRCSASVAINRNEAVFLDDLQSWQVRLSGQQECSTDGFSSDAAAETVDLADHRSVQRRLDVLFMHLGQVAAKITLPKELLRSQQTAKTAVTALNEAQMLLQEAERARGTASVGTEVIHLEAALARTKEKYQQVRTRSDFVRLVLGRECFNAGIIPSGCNKQIREIRQLQKHLKD